MPKRRSATKTQQQILPWKLFTLQTASLVLSEYAPHGQPDIPLPCRLLLEKSTTDHVSRRGPRHGRDRLKARRPTEGEVDESFPRTAGETLCLILPRATTWVARRYLEATHGGRADSRLGRSDAKG